MKQRRQRAQDLRNALELTTERVFQAKGTGHLKTWMRKSSPFEKLKYTCIDWKARGK